MVALALLTITLTIIFPVKGTIGRRRVERTSTTALSLTNPTLAELQCPLAVGNAATMPPPSNPLGGFTMEPLSGPEV